MVDLAFAFNPDHAEVITLINSIKAGKAFSHLSNPWSSSVPVFSGIEIKPSGKSEPKQELQEKIWCSAYLKFVAATGSGTPEMYPVIGITILAHTWKIWLFWLADDRENVVSSHPNRSVHGKANQLLLSL